MSKKILNIATTDQGGAGIASLYLNELFIKAGYCSILFVKDSKNKNVNVIVFGNIIKRNLSKIMPKLRSEFDKYCKRKNRRINFDSKYFFFNKNEKKRHITAKKILKKIPFNPDIIIFHSISGFINAETINDLAQKTHAKIFWLLMDNAPLTGGCHYPWQCKGFISNCSNCPAILNISKQYISTRNLSLKNEFLPDNIEIIACSESDKVRANESLLFKERIIHKIIFPIDENRFKPAEKAKAKEYFGISSTKKVILFGASTFSNIRKGNQYFIDSILLFQSQLKNENKVLNNYVILLTGLGELDKFSEIEIPIVSTGFLNESNLIKAYNASDVFVSTTLEDSGPLMINQSIMCGTPIISFGIGVANELVRTGVTGYKAKYKDTYDLAKGIKFMTSLSFDEIEKYSINCRELGLQNFSLNKAIQNYNEILLGK